MNQKKVLKTLIFAGEKVRVGREEGGVAVAAKKDLNPVLTLEGSEDVEAISIDIHPEKIIVSCTSAYGPQQRDSLARKNRFWEHLVIESFTALRYL